MHVHIFYIRMQMELLGRLVTLKEVDRTRVSVAQCV